MVLRCILKTSYHPEWTKIRRGFGGSRNQAYNCEMYQIHAVSELAGELKNWKRQEPVNRTYEFFNLNNNSQKEVNLLNYIPP